MSEAASATAVIRAEPDGYNMAKAELMGRQSAGSGFLRAAVHARGAQPITGFTPTERSARGFKAMVQGIDPTAPFRWIPSAQLERVRDVGVLYLADSTVATHARMRQRAGVASFSLCGVTHTTASTGAMDEIVGLLREPVAPWDALVCTSSAVVETVRRVHEAERDYQRWRYGADVKLEAPQLPLIPLGVHGDDYAFDVAAREDGRRALQIAPDEVAALFVGRLVYHAKAHPFPMFIGLQKAAERTGKRLVLIMSGWSPNEHIAAAFRDGAAAYAPDIRVIWLDGRQPEARDRAWAGADMFVSLSDNIQETFGLTPIEAMAAGLPVVVSDWNGYKDTVRHGVDGFRIRTVAPAAGMGDVLARGLETGGLSYDQYCWAAAQATVVDVAEVAEAIAALAENPELRRRMGDAGRARARQLYEWSVVYRQYQDLWADLNARRERAARDPAMQAWIRAAPRAAPGRLDPFHTFGHYPTATLGLDTHLQAAPGATEAALKAALDHPLFGGLSTSHDVIKALFELANNSDVTTSAAARDLDASAAMVIRAAGLLTKMGLLRAET